MERLTGEGFTRDGQALLGVGVYALISRAQVVYIGQARRLIVRIYTHDLNWRNHRRGYRLPESVKPIRFDDFMVYPCEILALDKVERQMIAMFQPKHNTLLMESKLVSIAKEFRKIGANPADVRMVLYGAKGREERRA